MFRFALAAAALLPASLACAAGDALIIGNARYSALESVFGAARVSEASAAFRDHGFDVTEAVDADAQSLRAAFTQYLGAVQEDDAPLIVVLSGAFAHGTGGAYLLPISEDAPSAAAILTEALPLDAVLSVLARRPGRSLLVLGERGLDADLGPYLQPGPGEFDIPQGVSVVQGPASDVARFAAQDLARPGRRLAVSADRWDLTQRGYAPAGLVILRRADIAAPRPSPLAQGDTGDTRAWQTAQNANTVDGYQSYLDAFPNGTQANAARQRIAALTEDPLWRERAAEEALALSRDARRKIQRDLSLLGYNTRGIDGIFGRGTRGAISSWQSQSGLPENGLLDASQIARLDDQARRRAAELEEQARIEREAQEERDRLAWAGVTGPNDESGLRAYMRDFPDGLFAQRAQELLGAIEARRAARAAGRDRRAWRIAEEAGTEAAYRAYLENNPQGAFRQEAAARIDDILSEAQQSRARERARAQEDQLGLNPVARRLAEARLQQLGLNPGAVDGNFDAETRRAIRQYQKARRLSVTGFLNQNTVVRLLADGILR